MYPEYSRRFLARNPLRIRQGLQARSQRRPRSSPTRSAGTPVLRVRAARIWTEWTRLLAGLQVIPIQDGIYHQHEAARVS